MRVTQTNQDCLTGLRHSSKTKDIIRSSTITSANGIPGEGIIALKGKLADMTIGTSDNNILAVETMQTSRLTGNHNSVKVRCFLGIFRDKDNR